MGQTALSSSSLNTQPVKQSGTQVNTDRQTDRQTGVQDQDGTDCTVFLQPQHTACHTVRYTGKYRQTDRQTDRQADRQTDRQTDRQVSRIRMGQTALSSSSLNTQPVTQWGTQVNDRQTQTDRQIDRQTDRCPGSGWDRLHCLPPASTHSLSRSGVHR